jgi:hypothetical protein
MAPRLLRQRAPAPAYGMSSPLIIIMHVSALAEWLRIAPDPATEPGAAMTPAGLTGGGPP